MVPSQVPQPPDEPAVPGPVAVGVPAEPPSAPPPARTRSPTPPCPPSARVATVSEFDCARLPPRPPDARQVAPLKDEYPPSAPSVVCEGSETLSSPGVPPTPTTTGQETGRAASKPRTRCSPPPPPAPPKDLTRVPVFPVLMPPPIPPPAPIAITSKSVYPMSMYCWGTKGTPSSNFTASGGGWFMLPASSNLTPSPEYRWCRYLRWR